MRTAKSWFEGWWFRHMARRETVEAMAELVYPKPGLYWHRCGPREYVVHVVR